MIRIMKYGEEPNSAIFARSTATADVSGAVAEIIDAVRTEGDTALRRFEEKFDCVKLDGLEVTAEILPISARLITNKASYEFCRAEIEAIRQGLLEQTEGKA